MTYTLKTEMDKTYLLAQYSFNCGEAIFYILDTPENVEHINKFAQKHNNKFFSLSCDRFPESVVDVVITSSGLKKLCRMVFYKCDTIEDMINSHLYL